MASAHDIYEKGLPGGDVESGSDGKGQSQLVDAKDPNLAPALSLQPTQMFEPPELIRNMTKEQRLVLETSLKRKIDLRLMPPIIIMYILNYLDRVSNSQLKFGILKLINVHRTTSVPRSWQELSMICI